jgi:hypothetical protein
MSTSVEVYANRASKFLELQSQQILQRTRGRNTCHHAYRLVVPTRVIVFREAVF